MHDPAQDPWEQLLGYLREELVNRSKDPGVWLRPDRDAQEIRIQVGDPGDGWCIFSVDPDDPADGNLRVQAAEMVEHALAGCPDE